MSDQIYLPDVDVTHHQVTLPTGVSQHYVTCGNLDSPKDGKIILFVHGWPDCWYGWRKQLPVVAKAGYGCIAIDIRGLGATKVLGPNAKSDHSKYTYQQENNDIVALMNHLHIQKVILVGHDWGGLVVWNCARRYKWRIHAVASMCTPYRPLKRTFLPIQELAKRQPVLRYQLYLGWEGETAAAELDAETDRAIRSVFRNSTKEDYAGKWMRPEYSKFLQGYPSLNEIKPSQLLSQTEYDNYVKVFKASGWRASLNWYRTDELNWQLDKDTQGNHEQAPAGVDGTIQTTVDIPALMITAGKDNVLTPKMAVGMEGWVKNLSRGHVEEAAHWIAQEQPEQVNTTLLDWIAKLPPIKENMKQSKL